MEFDKPFDWDVENKQQPHKNYKLDAEEREILEAFESGKLNSVPNFKAEKQKLIQAAKAHINKSD